MSGWIPSPRQGARILVWDGGCLIALYERGQAEEHKKGNSDGGFPLQGSLGYS
jgi:hypothetical protein